MSEKININDPSLLKKRFDDSGRSYAKYATAKGLQETALRRVVYGKSDGTRAKEDGPARKVFCHLKQDGIWIGKLPWEKLPSKGVA